MNYLDWKKRAFLVGSGAWFLPSGLSSENCLAAYQFKGASSEANALMDLSEYGHNLTKGSQTTSIGSSYSVPGTFTPTWSASSGFVFASAYGGMQGYLNNSTLNQQNIRAIVVRYSGKAFGSDCYLVTAGGADGTAQLSATSTMYRYTQTVEYTEYGERANYGGPGYVSAYNMTPSWGSWDTSSTAYSAAVVGCNNGYHGQLFINGTNVSSTMVLGWTYMDDHKVPSTVGVTFGNKVAAISALQNTPFAGKTIIAAAFFNVTLSADQHAEIAANMAQF